MAGTADALQAPGDRLRRLDLDHQVDRAHVDPELERAGRDQAGQLARLEQLLDDEPLLVGEGAVVGAGDLLEGAVSRRSLLVARLRAVVFRRRKLVADPALVVELVESLGEPFGAAAVVDEDDRRGVLADQLQQLRVDRRPDRARVGDRVERGLVGPGSIRSGERSGITWPSPAARGARSGLRHVLDRDDDLEVEGLADPRVDDLAFALRADQELGDPRERALRGREADPLRLGIALAIGEVREAFQRQRQVGAALGLGDGVDLVDDHRLDPGEDLVYPRGQHQIERLRGGDQDVGRLALHRLALALRRVAGAQADGDLGPDSLQRRPQVALDVVGESLQRGDVDDPHPLPELLGPARKRVDSPQECAQGLTGAGRRADQRVGAGGDLRPAGGLGGRRRLERRLEPASRGLAEPLQCVDLAVRLGAHRQPPIIRRT